MVRFDKKLEVDKAVIVFDPINMMDNFMGHKMTPNVFFHHQSMLKNSPCFVSIGVFRFMNMHVAIPILYPLFIEELLSASSRTVIATKSTFASFVIMTSTRKLDSSKRLATSVASFLRQGLFGFPRTFVRTVCLPVLGIRYHSLAKST